MKYIKFPDLLPYYPEQRITCGNVVIERFEIDAKGVESMRLHDAIRGRDETRALTEGMYVRLFIGSDYYPTMSNTSMEEETQQEVVRNARGHVLIGGLGLGWVALAIAAKQNVKSVTVVELSRDVITLVKPRIQTRGSKIKIIRGDAFKYVPPQKMDTAYYDIWKVATGNDKAFDEGKLYKHAKRFLRRGGWFGCWRDDENEEWESYG